MITFELFTQFDTFYFQRYLESIMKHV